MAVAITIYWLTACELVHVSPFPCRVIKEEVACEIVARLSHHVCIGVETIKLEEFVSSVAESGFNRILQVLHCGSLSVENSHSVHLLIVATDEQWYLSLLAIGEHIVWLLCPEISVDVIYRNTLDTSFLHKFLCRERTQLLDVLASDLLGHLHALSFSLLECGNLFGAYNRTARTHSLSEQSLAQRRCHKRADRHRTSRLAYNSDALRVASEGCDIVLYPFDGSHLVEETVVARAFVRCLLRKLRMCEESEDALAIVGCY